MEAQENPTFSAFPFEPYSIQIDFMKALYTSLDKGGVAMLESPTGTGKTLSIICSALQWVTDRKQKLKSEAAENRKCGDGCGSDDEPDWMRDFNLEDKNRDREKKAKNHLGFGLGNLGKRNPNKGHCRDLFSNGMVEEDEQKKGERNKNGVDNLEASDDEHEFLVDEYESEDEMVDGGRRSKRKTGGGCISLSSDDDDGEDGWDDGEEEEDLKIYFCSRTHSQLSQFVKELRKTVFASQMKVVSLGSRKNLCINEAVLKLQNSTRINERCLELQKNKNSDISKMKIQSDGGRIRRTKASAGCPMLRKHKLQKQLKDEASQLGALDIEDLVQLGNKIGTCPYYGSRNMVPTANLVVLPYQSLLLKSARESLGLNLKNSVIIIDEAHNLADSLTSMYDSKITLSQLEQVHRNLERYFERFRNLLGAGNRRYIQTLMVLTRAFLRVLHNEKDASHLNPCEDTENTSGHVACDSSVAINDFLFNLDIDNINLVKLQQYIKDSNIVHKVSGYGDKQTNMIKDSTNDNGGDRGLEGSTLSGFQALFGIVSSLKNNDGDGRVIISRRGPVSSSPQEEGYIKYVMLAGEKIFTEIVDQAHAVVLAGGTLQPIEETRERLFPWLLPEKLHFFSCSHIVPRESILPIAVSQGPSGMSFDFNYSSRSSPNMIEELGRLLSNLVTVVPEGIVVFFSSFEYERQVHDAWKASGILMRIMKKKRVFREPRSNVNVEAVLRDYKEAVLQSGAMLLAVVGGKISEGINFSDGMGRCVVMVGLPYPSPSDVELMERVKHIEGLGDSNTLSASKLWERKESYNGDAVQVGFETLRSCKRRGRDYYENLCMKAVNQSIGRAIRHINDYAAILLVDSRYSSDPLNRSSSHPTNKLPQWIKDCLVSTTQNYGEVHRRLHQFFKFNKQRGCQSSVKCEA